MRKEAQLTEEQQKLFDVNLFRVDQFVSRYRGRIDSDELKSKALEALFFSCKLWDPLKGSFLTYLNRSFQNTVSDVLEDKTRQQRSMPITEQKDLIKKLRELEDIDELVKNDPSAFTLEEVDELYQQIKEIRDALSIKNAPKNVSLESPVKEVEDGNIEMLDLIEDMQAISQEDQMAYNHLKKRIQDALTPRNYAIFELVEQGYTNQEIANRLNGQFPDEPNISVGEGVSVTMVEKIRPTIKKLLNQEEEYLRNL